MTKKGTTNQMTPYHLTRLFIKQFFKKRKSLNLWPTPTGVSQLLFFHQPIHAVVCMCNWCSLSHHTSSHLNTLKHMPDSETIFPVENGDSRHFLHVLFKTFPCHPNNPKFSGEWSKVPFGATNYYQIMSDMQQSKLVKLFINPLRIKSITHKIHYA